MDVKKFSEALSESERYDMVLILIEMMPPDMIMNIREQISELEMSVVGSLHPIDVLDAGPDGLLRNRMEELASEFQYYEMIPSNSELILRQNYGKLAVRKISEFLQKRGVKRFSDRI